MKKKKNRTRRIISYWAYKETNLEPTIQIKTFIGAFVGIGLIGYLQSLRLDAIDNVFLIGSFGASAVLVFGAPMSPLAQPRNLFGGHIISAIIGVTIHKFLPGELWLCAALAVSLSIILMQITKTMHPPGGATALIAVTGTEKINNLGYFYVLSPVFTGALILFLTAYLLLKSHSGLRLITKRESKK